MISLWREERQKQVPCYSTPEERWHLSRFTKKPRAAEQLSLVATIPVTDCMA